MQRLLQAGAIPFRRQGERIEYLLITSHKGNWIFPKGIVDPGDTPEITAEKETREEAGISGTVIGKPIGSYQDAKWGKELEVLMFILEFKEEIPWDEGGVRDRLWCSYEDARTRLKRGKLKRILDRAHDILSRQDRDPSS